MPTCLALQFVAHLPEPHTPEPMQPLQPLQPLTNTSSLEVRQLTPTLFLQTEHVEKVSDQFTTTQKIVLLKLDCGTFRSFTFKPNEFTPPPSR